MFPKNCGPGLDLVCKTGMATRWELIAVIYLIGDVQGTLLAGLTLAKGNIVYDFDMLNFSLRNIALDCHMLETVNDRWQMSWQLGMTR